MIISSYRVFLLERRYGILGLIFDFAIAIALALALCCFYVYFN